MAPKKGQKGQKLSLNEFLGDSGSWADEMDSLPSAPAARTDEERARPNDRYPGKRDDFLSSRPDRGSLPPREDLPLPSQPPYTAFIGNLSFDLTELELGEFFGSMKLNSIKIIKDRDDKPKGFGYIEFADLDGLKDALSKTGSSFSGRTIRVSVAEPPKERPGFAGGSDDDTKFINNWRRDGPLPDLLQSRDSSRRRFDGASTGDQPPGISEGVNDWRSTRSAGRLPVNESDTSFKRRGSGFSTPDGQSSIADKEEVWAIGSRFKPSGDDPSGNKFSGFKGRSDMGPPREAALATDEVDWRSVARSKPTARNSTSPNNSTPPTPQLSRRKLELLPRSASASATPSPLSSPKLPPAAPNSTRSTTNPFGAARPVDVTTREKEVSERIDKERESIRTSHSMSRTSSRAASERVRTGTSAGPSTTSTPSTPNSPKFSSQAAVVRPSISFATAASKKDASSDKSEAEGVQADDEKVAEVADKVAELVF